MNINFLERITELFLSLAEKLPENSKSLKHILQNIENLDAFKDKIKYAEKNLKHVSSGSSRIVFESPDHTIIKLAKNNKGLAQNKAEANPKMKSKYLNDVISKSKNYSWIQTHFLDKITEKDFLKMTNIKFEDFQNAVSYGLKNISESSKEKPKNFDEVSKSDVYKEIVRVGEKFKLMPGDIIRISSWGTKNNKPVLIDAGLTKNVFEEFYED